MTQERKSSHELDDSQISITLERLKGGIARKILRHENRTDLAEKNIRALNRQIESQALEIGHTLAGHEQSRRQQDLPH